MFRIKVLITICILGAIFAKITANRDPVVVEASEADLEEQLYNSLRELDEEFEQAAKCIKQRLQKGVPTLNIPQLDPIEYPLLNLTMDNDLVKSTMVLSNIKLEGLSEFNLTDGKLHGRIPNKMHMRVHIDAITINTGYHGSMTLFNMLKIFGNGNARISIKNFELDMTIYLNVNFFPPWNPKMQLTNLNLTIQLPSTEAIVTGLLDDERMSGLIGEQLSDVINTFRDEQSAEFNKVVDKSLWWFLDNKVNKILKNINAFKLKGMMTENVEKLCKGLDDFPEKYYQTFQTEIQDYLKVKLHEILSLKML